MQKTNQKNKKNKKFNHVHKIAQQITHNNYHINNNLTNTETLTISVKI